MKSEIRSFKESLFFALAGLSLTWRTQRNFRLHVLVGIAAVILGLIFDITQIEFLLVSSAIFFVLVLELVNTALETAVDLATREQHPLACAAKNVGAAAVLLAALYALSIGIAVFGSRVIKFLYLARGG